ncbi:uncharacterized protein A4U43_C09F2650 [Asparagus officinalis]|uniref:T-complex protein 11 n=1 Tax=Asparagus officinalis TaxID=4686 RepID=A0A5P1E528_ASPOF|nr:uncharacterized protein LOC109823615 [Asparagus officinalis]ONK57648.1 uncharacterized protein A4U43_C09F2650 [Asparagus officinalis]
METESPESGGGAVTAAPVAFEFPAGDPTAETASTPVKIPRRIRRRLIEGKSGSSPPSSVEEIEAKLKEADLRRQQFHEWLSNKARPKQRSPSWSSQEEDLGQRLEAKLNAAEQKRLSLLAKAQTRLAKLDELRQAAKHGVEIRYEKEREELGTKVESRVQQAQANRMRLLKDHMQRRAVAQERTARSLKLRMVRESKYKDCVQSAIFQKRVAAENKRMRMLEEEKTRVHARVMQVYRAAKTVRHQRENERRKMKEELENRLQRAKRQRAEYLKQRGSPHSSARATSNKCGDHLSRKLARCWRQFVRSKRTTFDLAKSYEALGINEKRAKSMPFEQLALCMESATTLQTVKAFLDRMEIRFLLSQVSSSSPENIDHLLKRLASPSKRTPSSKACYGRTPRSNRGTSKKGSVREQKIPGANKQSRYPVRVVLCAYMILGHPTAVFSERGEREEALEESSANFVREFELLIKIILAARPVKQTSVQLPCQRTFRSQLSAFDAAWRSYLYCFVVWKLKDARSLEDDLVRAACQLELSMLQTCKLTPEGQQTCDLTHDLRAIKKQVTEDQRLLRQKVEHLGGSAGIERMESALSDTRSKFFKAKDNGTLLMAPVAHVPSPSSCSSSMQPLEPVSKEHAVVNSVRSNVVRTLFSDGASSSPEVGLKSQGISSQSSSSQAKQQPTENELLVNEILHGGQSTLVDREETGIKAKVKETMEKAFWDGIMDSMREDPPDYSRILGLVMEVRDELIGMAPKNWKQEILDSIDMDILSQLLKSGTQDMEYLGRILEYALHMLQKLSAEAKEVEMKKTHDKLLMELASIAHSDDREKNSFVIAVIKGLRFVLEEIQDLKVEINKARMQIIKGYGGVEYLQKAFVDRYGPASGAADLLPVTAQWISSLKNISEDEWNEHNGSVLSTSTSHGLPVGTTLRTGGSIPLARNDSSRHDSGDEDLPECKGEKLDLMLRLGLLRLASGIEGLTVETVPETLEMNVRRLRSVQSQLQQIIVTSTSMLVLRQILLSENSALSPSGLENTISDSYKSLTKLLDTVQDVGIEEMVNTIASSSSESKLHTKKEMIARILTKSLQSNDAVFMKVSRSIYLSTRAVVLGGSGDQGRKLAEAALKRIGASMLLDQIVKAAKVLIAVARVSASVHGHWYRSLM